jgi:hypothetical protein
MPIHDHITPEQADLIRESKIFFVGSVHPELTLGPAGEGPLNVSPKGAVRLHVLDEHHVAYLDFHGSGNETARHAAAKGPVTVMVMSMDDENAAIVRLYGEATATPLEESPLLDRLISEPGEELGRRRQVIELRVDRTQTSCGYGVPVFEYVADRTKEQRGRRYWPPRAKSE